jgi:glutamate dehydrogenase/leucine dehydrogenase
MKSYPHVEAALLDAMRLAEGMTLQFATPGMPFGGGKAVIAVSADLERQSRAGFSAALRELTEQVTQGPLQRAACSQASKLSVNVSSAMNL